MFDELRDFIGYLEKEKELIKIGEELSSQYEISAVLREVGVEEGPAVLFQKVKGYTMAVVGNLLGTRRRMARILQTGEKELEIEYLKRKGKSIQPVMVKEGPVKDMIIKDNIDLLKAIPVLTHHEKDVGPYITAGVAIAKDPETGTRSMGLH